MKLVFIIFIAVFAVSHSFGQTEENEVTIEVTADHPDWTYEIGQDVYFTIDVKNGERAENDAMVKYQIGLERMTPAVVDSFRLTTGNIRINAGALNSPGFLRCVATIDLAGKTYRGLATAAVAPEKIEPTTYMPPDFSRFWDSLQMEAKKIPLNAEVRLLEDRSTDDIKAYEVNIQNIDGTLVYGMVTVPRKRGKYPAILKLPGAGVRAYGPDILAARRGFIIFRMGVHGIPLTMEKEKYSELAKGKLLNYPNFHTDNRNSYYFKRVIIGCIRSLDYLTSLPEFDGENLGVSGGSQGGALTIITAALDKRVKYLAAYFPALCDLTGPLHGRTGGWPYILEKEKPTQEVIETTRYYDVVNFAKLLMVPGRYTWGFNDETCPPTSIYAAYNSIPSPKDVFIIKEAGHRYFPEQRKTMDAWIEGKLTQKMNMNR